MTIQVDTDWWKNIFDAVYLMTDSRSICDDILTQTEVDFIETALSMKKSAPVLDLCGGQGRHAVELSRRGFTNVTVLDYSEYLIQMGKQQANEQKLNTFFVQGDARDTKLAEESFGAVIIMGGSFGYFAHDKENKKILKETFRLLMPKAELLLDLPDKKYVLKNFKPISIHKVGDTIEVTRTRELEHDVIYCREVVTCTEKGCLRENNYCVRLYTPEKISGILSSIGFSDISFQKDFMDRQEQGDYGTMTNRMVVKAHKKK
ncbi:MAG: class I SAM-dependent methyltransferase [Desulfobacula sp.]|nr:class I SAM-dependent methyltransferase [Desulfobacula sp.]